MANPVASAAAAPGPAAPAGGPAAPGNLIGRAGEPVRAVAFGGGAFDTVMHLGLSHALLVIKGRAPDAVIGSSAGAINAVALAEIMQAGEQLHDQAGWDTLGPREQQDRYLRSRMARFRKILAAWQRAPAEIKHALFPDMFQIEAQRPLQPLQLPIHERRERIGRQALLGARTGLINLYNELLEIRVSFGTIVRAVRRGLGMKAAAEVRSRVGRLLARVLELVRAWVLIGSNLYLIAPMVQTFFAPLVVTRSRHSSDEGGTAASLIFQPRWWYHLKRGLLHGWWFVVLCAVWIAVSLVIVGAPYVMAKIFGPTAELAGGWLRARWLVEAGAWVTRHPVWTAVLFYGLALLLLRLLLPRSWNDVLVFNRTSAARLLTDIGLEFIGLLFWLTLWAVLTLVVVSAAVYLIQLPSVEGLKPAWPSIQSFWRDMVFHQRRALWFGVALIFAFFFYFVLRAATVRDYGRRLLDRFDLADGILHPHPLRRLFVDLFDETYYGQRGMDDVLARAATDDLRPGDWTGPDKLLRDYEQPTRRPPIHVSLAAADVRLGTVTTVPESTKVVNALLAANAITPFLPAQAVNGTVFIDGTNVTRDPTGALLGDLRERVNPASTALHIYNVAALPFSRSSLDDSHPPEVDSVIEIAMRATQLQKFRDANLGRRLTELYTRVIPPGSAVFVTRGGKKYLRAWVTAVEPDAPLGVNRQVLEARKDARRRVIAEAVADGCRAALEVMLRESLEPLNPDEPPPPPTLRCRDAVVRHLTRRLDRIKADPDTRRWVLSPLPGSDESGGPGLPEVCTACALRHLAKAGRDPQAPSSYHKCHEPPPPAQTLVVRRWERIGPAWPLEIEQADPTPDSAASDPHFQTGKSEYDLLTRQALEGLARAYEIERSAGFAGPKRAGERWPLDTDRGAGPARPLVSLLFSGGVFRGVYQLGVLNALSEARLKPDVVAGASVGSITAAMVTRALTMPVGSAQRAGLIARLSATYLTVDKLVLTDRFADFIRNLTLRAAATRFSMRKADQLFRQYDARGALRFNREARLVVAGLERLFYISPLELLELVDAGRRQESGRMWKLVRGHLQEWLDRMEVGNQILGAEPLALLINEFVIGAASAQAFGGAEGVPLDWFFDQGVYFLATATNVSEGRLEILGEQQLAGLKRRARLLDSLLASSAFPAVFRPRAAWEVMPAIDRRHHYVDGGVMDNLPLDAVSQFLHQCSTVGLVSPRPMVQRTGGALPVPHMMFSASLEPRTPALTRELLDETVAYWPKLWRRAGQLGYNKKLETYAETQDALRDMWATRLAPGGPGPIPGWTPVDLNVVMVQPNWLCGTFSFHPMLGFRKDRQAASIAHGCATTLLELGRLFQDPVRRYWAEAWGISESEVPPNPPALPTDPIIPGNHGGGICHFRPDRVCPYSRVALTQLARLEPIPAEVIDELTMIHSLCGRREVHTADFK